MTFIQGSESTKKHSESAGRKQGGEAALMKAVR